MFPSVVILPFADLYIQLHFWPYDVDRCRFEMRLNLPPASSWSQRWVQEVVAETLRAGVLEDMRTLEPMQRSLKSGAKKVMPLSDQELLEELSDCDRAQFDYIEGQHVYQV